MVFTKRSKPQIRPSTLIIITIILGLTMILGSSYSPVFARGEGQSGSVAFPLDFSGEKLFSNLSPTFSRPESGVFRPLFAATPSLSLNIPPIVNLGENFTFTAGFSNTGDPGYGPFIDIVLPATGADGIYPGTVGGQEYDGVSFVNASFGGLVLPADQIFIQAFPDDDGAGPGTTGCVQHPIAVRPAGGADGHGGINPELPVYYDVCGPAGDQFVTIILPFGSFVSAQPPAVVTITAAMSNLADLNTPLNIYGQAGFRFGDTAINDFCCDPWDATWPVDGDGTYDLGDFSDFGPVEPSLLSISKAYIGPESETATGPNFPRQFTISVDIANNQVVGVSGDALQNLVITDTLPDNIQFLSIDSSSPSGATCTTTPSPLDSPGGEFRCSFDSITGGIIANDASITFSFFVDRLDESSAVVLNPITGAPSTSGNTASVTGTWDPIDARDDTDPLPTASVNCGVPCVSIQDQSITVQKSYLNITDGNTNNSPGDTLVYTIDFQISDFFGFQDLNITDTFSDGQRFDTSFNPTIQISGNGGNDLGTLLPTFTAVPMSLNNVDIACKYTDAIQSTPECDTTPGIDEGKTTIVFNVSDELNDRFASGQLLGGCVNPATANDPPDCTYNNSSTTGTITFRTVIQNDFSDEHLIGDNSQDSSVDHGDVLSNNVESIMGEVLDISVPPDIDGFDGTGQNPTDDSGVGVNIDFGVLTKDVYAVNGSTSLPTYVSPGDVVTYVLTYTQPTSDFEQTVLTDFFPLPVFDVAELTPPSLTNLRCQDVPHPNNVPPAGEICLGAGDTYHNLNLRGENLAPAVPAGNPVVTPSFVTNPAANSVTVTYPTYDSVYNIDSTIQLLISLTVEADPFADGLFLTNQVTSAEGTTNAGDQTLADIVQITIGEPELYTAKTAVSSDHLPDTDLVFTSDAALSGADLTAFESLIAQFAAPGEFVDPFSGTIASQDLSTDPANDSAAFDLFNSTLEGMDGDDLVKYAILVENKGHSENGAFDIAISDFLPPEMSIPPTIPFVSPGLNLQIFNGFGDEFGFEVVDFGPDGEYGTGDDIVTPGDASNASRIFDAGYAIRVVDPSGIDEPGACQVESLTGGKNIIVITYDLLINHGESPDTPIINTVSLQGYGSEEGGENYLETPVNDDAVIITIREPGFTKELTSTEIDNAVNSTTEVVIGEILTYTIRVKFFELDYHNSSIEDTLSPGLAFIDLISITNSNPDTDDTGPDTGLVSTVMDFDGITGDCTNCVAGTTTGSDNPLVTNNGGTLTFDFGDLTNSDDDNLVDETITIVYRAVALNVASSQAGGSITNSAVMTWDIGSITDDDNDAGVLEPVIVTTKISSIAAADAGDGFTYTITLTNPNTPNDTDAFEVEFLDNFPLCPTPADGSAVLDLALGIQSGPATFVLTEIGGDGNANGWQLTAAPIDMAPGDITTVNISGTIAYCVNPGLSLENTGTTLWTSLDGDFTTPRSSYNLIDSVERTGSDGVGGSLNDYASEGIAAIQIDNAVNTKYIISTSEAFTGLVNGIENLAIGEIVRFRLVSAVPESTSPNFQVRDLLPDGLIFLNDGTAVVAFVSTGGISSTSIGSLPVPAIPNCNQFGAAADASTPVLDPVNCTLADGNIGSTNRTDQNDDDYNPGTDPWFKLGRLVNNDSDLDQEYVVIEFNALVHNGNSTALQNDAGDVWSNRHQIYINEIANGSPSNSAQIRISEPIITVTKTLVAPVPVDARDPMIYDITFTNSSAGDSSATAYELVLNDRFDAYLENLTISSVTSSQGDWTDSNVICDGDGSGNTDFDVTRSLIGDQLTVNISCLDAGENVTVRVSGNVVDSVPAGVTIENKAEGIGTSLEGPRGTTGNLTGSDTPEASGTDKGERDGSDTDSGGQDDHYDTGVLNHTLQAPLVDKYVEDPGQFAIGETFTYDLVITLPDGITPDMVVYDVIPDGLDVISHNIITIANSADPNNRLIESFNGTLPSYLVTGGAGSGDDLSLNFEGNTITTAEYPNNPDNNSFQVQITVRMLNEADNQNGDVLRNQGELRYSSGNTATGTVDIEVIEPVLTIAKTVNDDTPELGDTVTFSIEVSHVLDGAVEHSQADAHNIQITDTLPTGLSDIANINPSSTGSCAAGVDTSNSTLSTLDVRIDLIPFSPPSPGCVVTITFDATVGSSLALGTEINNTSDLTWTSLPGSPAEERIGNSNPTDVNDYETSDGQLLTVTNPELEVNKDDYVEAYVPGLSVVYEIEVSNIGNGDVIGALVSDDIPSQVSTWTWVCSSTSGGATGCDGVVGSSVNFTDTVNMPASSTITYQVTANISSSATGEMTNTVIVSMPDGVIEPTLSNNTASDMDNQDSQADLAITKDDGVTIIAPGVTLPYTIVVSNNGPSDVLGATVTDNFPVDITSASWTCVGSVPAATCTSSGNGNISDTVDIPYNESITYSVNALVSSSANGDLTNTVTVTAPSYVVEIDTANNSASDTDSIPEITKDLTGQEHGVTTLPDVAIGEIITYRVVLTVPEGTMPNLHLVDSLDRGLAFVGCEPGGISGAGLTMIGPANFDEVCANPAVSPTGSLNPEDDGRQVDFDFGILENTTGNPVDLIVIYQVVVLDSLGNQSNSTPPLNNAANWIWASGDMTVQAQGITILEPDLSLTKEVDKGTILPGELRTFTITIEHTGDSQTYAYDVELIDTLPPELDLVGTVRVSGPGSPAVDVTNLPEIAVRWPELPDAGTVVVEIDVMLDPVIEQPDINLNITNLASVSWTSLPGVFSTPQSDHNSLSTERFYDPDSNINIYSARDSARLVIPKLPDTGFAPGRITQIPSQAQDQRYGDLDGLRLEIPKLKISVPILSVPRSSQGWDLTWLWNKAGWLEGTAYPSWIGNTVLTGHAYLPSGLPGPFVALEKMSWGDEIYLYAHGLKYTYQVREHKLVSADDIRILGHKDQDWLTLFTCKDYNELTDDYNWRQAIQAVMIDVEEIQE